MVLEYPSSKNVVGALRNGLASVLDTYFATPNEVEEFERIPMHLVKNSEYEYYTSEEAAEHGKGALTKNKLMLDPRRTTITDEGKVSVSSKIIFKEYGTYVIAVTTTIDFAIEESMFSSEDDKAYEKRVVNDKINKIKSTLKNDYYIFGEPEIKAVTTEVIEGNPRVGHTYGTIEVTYTPVTHERITDCTIPEIRNIRKGLNHRRLKSQTIKEIEQRGGMFLGLDWDFLDFSKSIVSYIPGYSISCTYVSYSDYENKDQAAVNADQLLVRMIDNASRHKNICSGLLKIGNLTGINNKSTGMNIWKDFVDTTELFRYNIDFSYDYLF